MNCFLWMYVHYTWKKKKKIAHHICYLFMSLITLSIFLYSYCAYCCADLAIIIVTGKVLSGTSGGQDFTVDPYSIYFWPSYKGKTPWYPHECCMKEALNWVVPLTLPITLMIIYNTFHYCRQKSFFGTLVLTV